MSNEQRYRLNRLAEDLVTPERFHPVFAGRLTAWEEAWSNWSSGVVFDEMGGWTPQPLTRWQKIQRATKNFFHAVGEASARGGIFL